MVNKSFLLLAFVIQSSIAIANPIDLVCKDTKTHGFRHDGGLAPQWGDETFNSSWRIQYDGFSDQAIIDGKSVMAIKGNDTAILLEYSANQTSQSLWAYAIHLGTGKVTAAQVNVYDLMGAGVKSRNVEFSCK